MSSNVLYIALGGAIGAMGRHVLVSFVDGLGRGLPFGTLVVNIVGSAILGGLVEVFALYWSPGPEIRAMIVVGMLGAFTTFSAFSLDIVTMLTRGEVIPAFAYVVASVVLSVGAFWLGMTIMRHVLT